MQHYANPVPYGQNKKKLQKYPVLRRQKEKNGRKSPFILDKFAQYTDYNVIASRVHYPS